MLKKLFVAAAVTAACLGLFANAGTAAAGSWPGERQLAERTHIAGRNV